MKSKFNSKNYVFRPTTMSAALVRGGIRGKSGPSMVREPVAARGGVHLAIYA